MFTSIEEFSKEWVTEAKLTSAVLEALTDESLKQRVAEGRRTLGDIAWHLVASLGYMASMGLEFSPPDPKQNALAAGIAAEYSRVSSALMAAVRFGWNDEILLQTQEMGEEIWSNGGSLRFTIMHQAHHRGQMTVLMRQAGLRVPDVYGPSYDSWMDRGMTPLA